MRDRTRTCAGVGASVALALAVLPSGMLAQSASPAASGFPTPLLPSIDLSAVGGKGEGALNIIAWVGYAEDGSNVPEYDWVHGFQDATGCQVNVKIDDTSDQMVADMAHRRLGWRLGVRRRDPAPHRRRAGRGDRHHHDPRVQRCGAVPPGRAPLRGGRQALRRAPRLGRQLADVQHGRLHRRGRAGMRCSTRPRWPATAARSRPTTAPSTSRTRPCTSRRTGRSWASPMSTS